MRSYGPEDHLMAVLTIPFFLIAAILWIGMLAAWGYILWRLALLLL